MKCKIDYTDFYPILSPPINQLSGNADNIPLSRYNWVLKGSNGTKDISWDEIKDLSDKLLLAIQALANANKSNTDGL